MELIENEWAKAANLREKFWLHVICDYTAAHPHLLQVQNPFAKLLVLAEGGVVNDEASAFEAPENDQ